MNTLRDVRGQGFQQDQSPGEFLRHAVRMAIGIFVAVAIFGIVSTPRAGRRPAAEHRHPRGCGPHSYPRGHPKRLMDLQVIQVIKTSFPRSAASPTSTPSAPRASAASSSPSTRARTSTLTQTRSQPPCPLQFEACRRTSRRRPSRLSIRTPRLSSSSGFRDRAWTSPMSTITSRTSWGRTSSVSTGWQPCSLTAGRPSSSRFC